MLALMHMTWIINRRLLFQFSPYLALYLWMIVKSQGSGEVIQLAVTLVFFASLLTVIVTFQGLLLPVEDFILSLPVSRAEVVRVKYLSSLLGLFAGLALPLLAAWIAHVVAPARIPAISAEITGIAALAALYLAFGIFLFLPFVYRFGPARGLTFFSLTLVFSLAIAVARKGRTACIQALLDFSSHFLQSQTFAMEATICVVLFGIASLLFSTWAYQQKASSAGNRLSFDSLRAAPSS